jgi:hypothetical protein
MMSQNPVFAFSRPVEALHLVAMSAAAASLLFGMVMRRPFWVNTGVSLILLLPPLRLATTIAFEARAKRYFVALMGIAVLTFLLVSRRVS